MDLNEKHKRRLELRKGFIVGAISEEERFEYFSLEKDLLQKLTPGTVGYHRVKECIPGEVE